VGVGDKRNAELWWGNLKQREHWKYLSVDGKIILKTLLNKYDGGRRVDSSGTGREEMADCCLHDNEHLGATKCGKFLY
jgi:hypothetical protein